MVAGLESSFVSHEMLATSPVCEYDASVLATHPDKSPLLRTLLILGRVSNLPTVWSNRFATSAPKPRASDGATL